MPPRREMGHSVQRRPGNGNSFSFVLACLAALSLTFFPKLLPCASAHHIGSQYRQYHSLSNLSTSNATQFSFANVNISSKASTASQSFPRSSFALPDSSRQFIHRDSVQEAHQSAGSKTGQSTAPEYGWHVERRSKRYTAWNRQNDERQSGEDGDEKDEKDEKDDYADDDEEDEEGQDLTEDEEGEGDDEGSGQAGEPSPSTPEIDQQRHFEWSGNGKPRHQHKLPKSSSTSSLPSPFSTTTQMPLSTSTLGKDGLEFVFTQESSTPACSSNEFFCHSSGYCLPVSLRCDRKHCKDNFENCTFNVGGTETKQCPDNMFLCRDGQCVPSDAHCDFTSQIICGVNEFDCGLDGQMCIHESLRCDGYYDCPNSYLDEMDCENRTCRLSQFRCANGQCIDRAHRCDGQIDCKSDMSDELECWICRIGEYNCHNGQCVDRAMRCNGIQECTDNSDEVDCPNSDIVLQLYPERQTVRQGQEAVFRCRDESEKHLDVSWSREGQQPLPPGATDSRGRLSLINVQTNYSGVYVCSVSEKHQQTFRAQKAASLTVLPTFDIEIMINHSPQNDPEDVPAPSQKECEPDHFQCDNGNCINQNWICNGFNECGDGSDEISCKLDDDGNSTCKADEYQCESGNQCIPKDFHCDGQSFDCVDKSDEIGCTSPTIVESPNAIVVVTEGESVTIKCRSIGIPVPFISWHKNGKHIPPPPRVTSSSVEGLGTLTIRDATFSDQGTYSCEASNSLDAVSAVQDTLLVIKSHKLLCQSPVFNDLAHDSAECLRCFCFGVSEQCHSSSVESRSIHVQGNELSIVPLEPQMNGTYADVSHRYPPNQAAIRYEPFTKSHQVNSEVAAIHTPDDVCFYWRLPEAFLGNQLFSYGGHLKYTIRFQRPFSPSPLTIPDVIIRGNGITLYHYERDFMDNAIDESKVAVRFWAGEWHRDDRHANSDIPPLFEDTTREDIMIVLQNISDILIKASYDANLLDSSILDVELESAQISNFSSPERSSYIEQCKCPEGYTGSSCEQCAPRYIRQPAGQYLGRCIAAPVACQCNGHSEECDQFTGQCLNCAHNTEGFNCERCQRGFYTNPELGSEGQCSQCPCGQNMAEHVQIFEEQWDETFPEKWLFIPCRYDTLNRDVVCETCPIGYEGRLCRECARGYSRRLSDSGDDYVCELKEKCNDDEFRCGNGTCVAKSVRCNRVHDCVPEGNDEFGCDNSSGCNAVGTLALYPSDPSYCQCKGLVSGAQCDQCKPGAFFLNELTLNGCIECFCFGLTRSCSAAFNLYRDYVELKMEQYKHGIVLRDLASQNTISEQLSYDHINRELIYRDFTFQDDLFWQLPYQFLGNKITSYGGYLNYTFRFEGNHFPQNDQVPTAILTSGNASLHYYYKSNLSPFITNVIAIPLLEDYWSLSNGQPAHRRDLMMALARLDAILLRATMSSDVSLIGLSAITLDSTVERSGSDPAALGHLRVETVEECRCPLGYMGSSCERCSPGYKLARTLNDNENLLTCEPCFCNGHSNYCDSESGVCTDCQHYTTGPYCEKCVAGYEGNAARGTPYDCISTKSPFGVDNSLEVDNFNAREPVDRRSGECKVNVEGYRCDHCKDGFFHLDPLNPLGCLQCYCSGVTRRCSSSSFIRQPIQFNLSAIYPPQDHKFELTNRFRTRYYSEHIRINSYHNELYFYSNFWHHEMQNSELNEPNLETLYWSLPPQFLGNRLSSYGGQLRYKQRYATQATGKLISDVDVFMLGNGIMLQYINSEPFDENEERLFVIPINAEEGSWQKIDHQTQSTGIAERLDFLRALTNLSMIAIRATLHNQLKQSVLKDVSLDEAVPNGYGTEQALSVEQCFCPVGYIGLSCEQCAPGYIRLIDPINGGAVKCLPCHCNSHSSECDSTGRCLHCQDHTSGHHCEQCAVGFFGDATRGTPEDCSPCACPSTSPSNNFSPTCVLDPDGRHTCTQCQSNYAGRHCERCNVGYAASSSRPGHCEPVRNVSHSHGSNSKTIRVFIEGPPVRHVPAGVTVNLKCSGVSKISQFAYNLDWIKLEGQLPTGASEASGVLTLPNIQPEHSGTYICTGSDLESVAQAQTFITVESAIQPAAPKVKIEPRFQEVYLGEPVTFKCIADGYPQPQLHWTKGQNEILNPLASFTAETGVFFIPAAQKTDEAEYHCQATNSVGSDSVRTVLFVRPSDYHTMDYVPVEGVIPTARVSPANYVAVRGESNVRLECNVTGVPVPSVRWTFTGGGPDGRLPPNSRELGGVLLLSNVELVNGGVYTCIASNSQGTAEAQVRLKVVLNQSAPPTVNIEPFRQTIVQGQTGELRCVTTGSPKPVIAWQKIGDQLDHMRHKVLDDKLVIERMEVNDRGLYVCRAENSEGISQGSAVVEIELREIPSIEIFREAAQTVPRGSSTYFECRITGGIPEPNLEWRRSDGSPFTSNVQVSEGLLRFKEVTAQDEGTYICTADNLAGRVSADATLHIAGAPRIKILQSTPFRVRSGEHVRLECRLSSPPPNSPEKRVSLNWYKLRVNQYDNQSSYLLPTHPVNIYQDHAILEIRSVKPSDNGIFVCTGSAQMGNSEERIQVIVEEQSAHIVPDVYIEDKVVTVAAGSRAELRCFVRGTNRNVVIKWVRADNKSLPDMSRVENGTLTIDQVKPDDSGDYLCLGYLDSNSGGQGSPRLLFRDRARLAVVAPPKIQIYPPLQTVRPGDTVYIDCVAFDSTHSVTVHWSRIGAKWPTGVSTEVAGARLIIRGVQATDAGKYLCTASNAAGKTWGTGEVIVDKTSEPIDTAKEEMAILGSNLDLKCPSKMEDSDADLMVWWKFDNSDSLPSNTQVVHNELRIQAVQLDNSGRYICTTSLGGTVIDQSSIIVKVKGPSRRNCKANQFQCTSGECVPLSARCNGIFECQLDSSDEDDCRAIPTLDVKLIPSQEQVHLGDTLMLNCSVQGDPMAEISWVSPYQNGYWLDNVHIDGNILNVSQVRHENGGVIRCVVKTYAGVFNADFVLVIQAPPTTPMPELTIVETHIVPFGSSISLPCKTNELSPIRYSWKKSASNLDGGVAFGETLPEHAVVHDNGTLFIPKSRPSHAGTYICTAASADSSVDIATVLVVEGIIPRFLQKPISYMSLPRLPNAKMAFNITISVKPEKPDGLILFNEQFDNHTGDFISLGLSNGKVEFRFELGGGIATIISDKPITTGEWHLIQISRKEHVGKLKVDNQMIVTSSAKSTFIGLDLLQPLFIGGVPNLVDIPHSRSGFTSGFFGCISLFRIGSRQYELIKDSIEKQQIGRCETCLTSPCQNSGTCRESPFHKHGFECVCPVGFSGLRCELTGGTCHASTCNGGVCHENKAKKSFSCLCPFGKGGHRCERNISITEPSLANGAYLAYRPPLHSLEKLHIKLKIKPRFNLKGGTAQLLLYSAQHFNGSGDFAALTLVNQTVQFRFDTGSGAALIQSPLELTDNEWVDIEVDRNRREASLIVGNSEPVFGQAPGRTHGLTLLTPMYIGGLDRSKTSTPSAIEAFTNFEGCLGHLELNHKQVNLLRSHVESVNVENCDSQSSCQLMPCLNGGSCMEEEDSENGYSCFCEPSYTGRYCDLRKGPCDQGNQCSNKGECQNDGDDFLCHCPIGFTGKTCTDELEMLNPHSAQMNGLSFLSFDNSHLTQSNLGFELIKFRMKTTQSSGLLFFYGQSNEMGGNGKDFMAVSLNDTKLEMTFELGSGLGHVFSDVSISDDKVHDVILKLAGREGSIEVDGHLVSGQSAGALSVLNADGDIFFGGLPDFALMTGGRYKSGFVGCIWDIQLGGHTDVLDLRESSKRSRNISPCEDESALPPADQ